jgi:hypothetical protein
MPGSKHLRGVRPQEQREYEHLKNMPGRHRSPWA